MKKTALCLILVLFSPLSAMNFDDLFAGLGDGPDPFGDIFATPPGGDDPFEHSMGMFGAPMDNGNEEKKEVTLPDAKTTKEAFSIALPEGAHKIPKMHKQAVKEFFGELTEKLNTLSVVPTRLVLGSRLREQLQPAIDTIITADKHAEQIFSQSVYYFALFSKEHNSLRQRITKAITESDKVIGLFFDLDEVDSLKGPSSRQKRKRKQAFDKMTGLVKRSIEPIAAGLQKVIDDAKSAQQIETKKKKYAERAQKAQSGQNGNAFGGWSSGANDYFGDSYSMGGFGTNGWDYGMGANNWDSLLGGSDSFGSGFGGGFDSGFGDFGGHGVSSGGYGDYHSYDGNAAGSDGSSGSTSFGSGMLWGGPEKDASSSLVDTDTPDTSRGNPFLPANSILDEHAPAPDRYEQLAQKTIERLSSYTQDFTIAENKKTKEAFLHKTVSDPAFSIDITRLTTLAELSSDPAVTAEQESNEAFAALTKKFEGTLQRAIPFLVAAAKYTAPPFSRLTEEHLLKKSDATMEQKSAQIQAKQHQHHRDRSYRALIGWLGTIRLTGQESMQQAVVRELHTHTQEVISALNNLLESMPPHQPVSFKQTEQLDTLSRQLLQEPIVIGYSTIPNEVSTHDAAQKKTFAKLINDKKTLESKVIPLLKSSTELFEIMRQTLQNAIMKVREAIENKTTILTDPSALSAVSREMETILNTTYSAHPALPALKKAMIPYNKEFFEQLEVQTVLHSKLTELWQHEESNRESEYMPPSHAKSSPPEESPLTPLQEPILSAPPASGQPEATDGTTNLGPFEAADFSNSTPPQTPTTPPPGVSATPQVFSDEYLDDYEEKEEGFFDGATRIAKSSGIFEKAKKFGKQLLGSVASDMQSNIRGAVNRSISKGINQVF